jgi:hypothetical protein
MADLDELDSVTPDTSEEEETNTMPGPAAGEDEGSGEGVQTPDPEHQPEEDGNGEDNTPDGSDEEEEVGYTGTQFSVIYNRFLGKITDDMYMELTPEDTIKDLQNLLIDAIDGFEFPRCNLVDYDIKTRVINEADARPGDFILAVLWAELPEDGEMTAPDVLVERSSFASTLTSEEINILALLMKQGWVQRQVASIEVTRMKYTGADFKMTSQANHLAKLLSLLEEARREAFHMQRLYKRRKRNEDGTIASNWSSLREKSALDGRY